MSASHVSGGTVIGCVTLHSNIAEATDEKLFCAIFLPKNVHCE